jgi:TonB family protein
MFKFDQGAIPENDRMFKRVSGVVGLAATLAMACAVFTGPASTAASGAGEPMSLDRAVELLLARKQVAEAVAALESRARQGDGRSSLLLGTLLLEGHLAPADLPRGLAFVRLGARTHDPFYNATIRKKVVDLASAYESRMSGRQLIESDRILGEVMVDINRHFLECIGSSLASLTSGTPVAIEPTIRFAEEPVRVSRPKESDGHARLGCAAAPDSSCPDGDDPTVACTGEIVHIDEDWVSRPASHIVQPKYPADARRKGTSGAVSVAAHVATNGLLCSAVVVALPSEDADSLAKATLDAIRYWKVDPATRDGQPVESLRLLTATFVLTN